VTAAAAAALSSCGSSSSGNSGGTSASTASKANLQHVSAQIDKYSAIPSFHAPGPAFSTTSVKGKTVFSIPDSTANPFAATILSGEAQAAQKLGIHFQPCQAQGQVSDWVRCYNEAISRRVNLLLSCCGVDPRVVRPQISNAQDAKIPVLAPHVYGFTQQPVAVNYSVPAPYELAGRLVADWIIKDTKGQANVLVVTSNEVTGTPPLVSAIKSEFSKYCGSNCTLTYVNVPVADWATKIQTNVQSALTGNPDINYVLPLYDSMTQFVVPAILGAQKVGEVHIATFNGTPFVLKYMQTQDIVRMDVGEDENWLGWAYMDAAARVLAGQKVPRVFDEKTPLRVFTKANVDQAGTPPKISQGYGKAYISGYEKLWGVQ
jgi:ribose transport system substrate-binding protein